jgi:hypothetical protein
MPSIERMRDAVTAVIDDVRDHLRGLGLRAEWQDAPDPADGYRSGTLSLDDGTSARSFQAVATAKLSTASIALLPHDSTTVLLTQHVSPTQADTLSRRGWGGYADASGNASLRAQGLFLEITGRRSRSSARTSTSAPFTRAGLPVTFAVLTTHVDGDRPLSQRDLAAASGASIGTVNRVVRALRERTPPMLDARNELLRPEALRDEWIAAYTALQAEVWPEERFDSEIWSAPSDLLQAELPPGTLLGSELAAVRLGASLRPAGALLHVPTEERGDVIRRGRLRRAENGPIRLRPAFWTSPPADAQGIAPLPLLAADLLLEDDPRLDEIRDDLCGDER